jgi:trk system potassium uptake protein TrkA
VKGSASSLKVLKDAQISKTDIFIAITELEEMNLTASILAKHLGAKLTVSRVNNHEYIEAESQQYFHTLGIDHLIYPEILGAREVVSLLRQSGNAKIYDFSEGKLSLVVLKLSDGASIVGKTLKQATAENPRYDYRAVAITRGGKTIIPTGDDIFLSGDMAYIISTPEGMSNLLNYTGKEQFQVNNIMILGGSRIGKKTAQELEKYINIKMLEIDSEKCESLAEELTKTLILNTNGRDIDVMIEEGIVKMDAFVAVTGNSETNILSCIYAQKLGVKKTIAEIENMDYIDLAENMGIHTIINKKRIAASRIFSFAMNYQKVDVQIEFLNGTDAEILDFIVHEGSKITTRRLKNLDFPEGAIIGGIIRGSKGFIATGNMRIEPDDHVIMFAKPQVVDLAASFFI